MADGLLQYFTDDAIRGYIAFQVIVLLIVVSNAWLWRRMRRHPAPDAPPTVSVLVPCRNEEANAAACLRSILSQEYPSLEVIALDDHSQDGTLAVLEAERDRDSRLRIVRGDELPEGWTGKNWACHQLSQAATGEVLFFVDADVVLQPHATMALVGAMHAERAGLLSGVPKQDVRTVGEQLLVPVFGWSLLSFMPLVVGLISPRAGMPAALGQLMLFTRDAYETVGGHAGVRTGLVDDLDLARAARTAGVASRLADATALATCRMYRSGAEAYRGFRKNLFPAFGSALLTYLFVWIWIAFFYLEPLVVLGLGLTGLISASPSPALIAATVGLALAQWLLVYWRLRLPMWPAVFYPVTVLAFEVLVVGSLIDGLRRRTTWKGRSVEGPPVRLV